MGTWAIYLDLKGEAYPKKLEKVGTLDQRIRKARDREKKKFLKPQCNYYYYFFFDSDVQPAQIQYVKDRRFFENWTNYGNNIKETILETDVILESTLPKSYFISLKINSVVFYMSHNSLITLEDTKMTNGGSQGVFILGIHFWLCVRVCVCNMFWFSGIIFSVTSKLTNASFVLTYPK